MKFLLLLAALSLQAQNGVLYIPPTIYPGSRLSIFVVTFELGSLQMAPPAPFVTVTVQGREYRLPWIAEKFPPVDELSPNPTASAVYLVPPDLPVGPATIRYRDFTGTSEIGGPAPNEIYRLAGTSIAYAQQQTGSGALRRNRLTDPARPGDRITLWGTGFDRASVIVAGTQIEAALAHQSDGLDRIEFTLPADTPGDCSLPVAVNQTSIAISTVELGGSVCPHRLGITPADLLRLDRGGSVPMATFQFRPKFITVRFGDFTLAEVPAPVQFDGSFPAGCKVAAIPYRLPDLRGTADISVNGFPRPELISPSGVRYTSKMLGTNSYEFSSPTGDHIWIPGTWTFRFSFLTTVEVKVSARTPLRFTNAPDLANFTRDRDFALNWDPSLGTANEGVTFDHTQLSERPVDGIIGHKLTCREPIPAGRLTIPGQLLRTIQWLTSALPATTSASSQFQPSISRTQDGRYLLVTY